MKGIITILMIICFGVGVNGQQNHKQQPKAVMKKEGKAPVKTPAVKKPKSVAKVEKAVEEPVAHIDTPEVAAMPDDTGLITQNENIDTVMAQPEEIVIWKDPVDTFSWLPWLSLIVAVGMGVYVIWANSIIRVKLKRIEENRKDTLKGMARDTPKPHMSSIEVESLITSSPVLKKIQEECSSLKAMVEKLQPVAKVIPIQQVPVVAAGDEGGGTFYMTGPTSNYFPANARSSHKENTLYKFVLQPGGNEAKFELHTMGASVSEIIKVVESYIKPACDEDNLPTAGTRNIVTKKPGIAILENEKWVIKSKAIIKYE